MFTLSEENYLKAIYHLQNETSGEVSTNAIAERIKAKASSVSDMLKKLAEKEVVLYKKHRGVSLTKLGMQSASKVVRKHRLWEVFLADKLHFPWDEVHDIAEQLEHIKSEKLTERLDQFLGFPKHDPHGDPIPDRFGNVQDSEKKILSELIIGQEATLVGVGDSSAKFLQFLDKNKIALWKSIIVLEKEDFDNSLRIKINDQTLHISEQIATNLYIKEK